MFEAPAPSPLLALPDPCLLAVLQCCAADDQRSLFIAARAHSRLHQAAVAALGSISIDVGHQQHADTVLLYLDRHSRHINSLQLRGPQRNWRDRLTLRQLPPTLQLHSLELEGWRLHLLPSTDFQGVLGAAAAAAGAPPLKQLQLKECTLLDGVEGLAAALQQLPALKHFSLCNIVAEGTRDWARFPTGLLQQLQQLSYLELGAVRLQGPDPASPVLQPLQGLTRLVDLRLASLYPDRQAVTASMLSGVSQLTRLALVSAALEPAAMAGKAKLQHLELYDCDLQPAGGAGVAALLSQLQHQTQLTYLVLRYSMLAVDERSPPAAAYSAVTASSKLQHLNISGCKLPATVWQHLFPAGRQLLQLTSLDISGVWQLLYGAASAPESSRIVSCCPCLQSLNLCSLRYSAQQLTQLQALSGLHTLQMVTGSGQGFAAADTGDALHAVCQLTGLGELGLYVCDAPTQLLVRQLQQLQQLSHLTALEYAHEGLATKVLKQKGPGDKPVWRQLLQFFRQHSDADVAEEAAAALEQ